MDNVVINIASFEDGRRLHAAILKAAKESGLDFSKVVDDVDIGDVMTAVIGIDISPEVYAALWPCLARCLYKGEKIMPHTFETAEAREQYYPIVAECIKVNCSPFFKGLLSRLLAVSSLRELFTQKLESTMKHYSSPAD